MNKFYSLFAAVLFATVAANAVANECKLNRETTDQTNKKTTHVYFANGILTDETEAIWAVMDLCEAYQSSSELLDTDSSYEFMWARNDTYGLSDDIAEVIRQKQNELGLVTEGVTSLQFYWWMLAGMPSAEIQSLSGILAGKAGDGGLHTVTEEQLEELSDFTVEAIARAWIRQQRNIISDRIRYVTTEHVKRYVADLRSGKKVIVIAHSQGNLFANEVIDTIGRKKLSLSNSIAAIGVASPAARVVGSNIYITAHDDRIIDGLRFKLFNSNLNRNVLESNIDNDIGILKDPRSWFNHLFIEDYFDSRLPSRKKIDEKMKELAQSLPYPPATTNQPPSVDAGADQEVIEGTTVMLQGTGSDTDGTIASYSWTRTSGPAVTMSTADQATASFVAPGVATNTALVFRLTVTDDEGATAIDEVTVTVIPNQPPSVDAGADQEVIEGTTVTLQGTGSDIDGTIAGYSWRQISGPSVTLSTEFILTSADQTATSFTAPAVATNTALVFRLAVVDDKDATAIDEVTVTVIPVANELPRAMAGADQIVSEGATVTLQGSASDADGGSIARYSWTQIGSPAVALSAADQAVVSFTAPAVATNTALVFRLTVTDDDGATASDEVTVTVIPAANEPPSVEAGVDQMVSQGTTVTLQGSASDADGGTIASYTWTQIGSPAVALSAANQATTSFVAPSVGANTALVFRLTVTDDEGAMASDEVTVTVISVGEVFRDCGQCPEMVVIPAGSFLMGSPSSEEGRDDDEGPQHRVEIAQPFAVGKYEVTFAEWDACRSAGGCSHNPYDAGWGRGNRPVIYVSWEDTQEYVVWLSSETGKDYRLLTEAEWEYVARAGTTTPFHTGVTISTNQANYNGNHIYGSGTVGVYRGQTVEVGMFAGNAFGLHDMHGNVDEWVEDCEHDNYAGAPADGSAWTEGGDCGRRLLRGGSLVDFPGSLRAANRASRTGYAAGLGTGTLGFRVARTLTSAEAGADQVVNQGTTVMLQGLASYADNTIASYFWTQLSGPTVILATADQVTASFVAPSVTGNTALVLVFRLTVTDDEGAIASDEVTVTVLFEIFRDCGQCPEMVRIPAGSFLMGSPSSEEDRNDDEGPQHRVEIAQPFAVGRYEVTFAEWDACRSAGGCSHNPDDRGWGRGNRPVIDVSWEDTQEYVGWLSRETGKDYRLLTEAEWEYAARAGTTTPFHTGRTISTDQANYDGRGIYGSGSRGELRRQTVEVGSFAGNAFGLQDVHGNVREWVEDCWHANYEGAPVDGSAWTEGGNCSRRVFRGGSWSYEPGSLRAAFRVRSTASDRFSSSGFRVARTLTP